MSRRVPLLLTVAFLTTSALAAACTGSAGPGPSPVATLPSSPTSLPQMSFDQFKQMLGALKGKPVVVNIWASWCSPCRGEAPGLEQLAKQYQGKVQFVGVDVADQTGPARAFIQRYGWTYPSVSDPKEEIKRGYGLLGQPDTIIYDAKGKLAWPGQGYVQTSTLRRQIQEVLGQT